MAKNGEDSECRYRRYRSHRRKLGRLLPVSRIQCGRDRPCTERRGEPAEVCRRSVDDAQQEWSVSQAPRATG